MASQSPDSQLDSLYDASITSAAHYKSLMDKAIKENGPTNYILPAELARMHEEAKREALDVNKDLLKKLNINVDANFLKELTNEIKNHFATYNRNNDELLQPAIDSAEGFYYKARCKYDSIRGQIQNYETVDDLLVDHKKLKSEVLQYFSNNCKSKSSGKLFSEYKQKLDKDLEDFFVIYKNLVELKHKDKLNQDELKVSLIYTETLNFYKSTIRVMSEDQLHKERDVERVLLDVLDMFRREIESGVFGNEIAYKYLNKLKTDARNVLTDYEVINSHKTEKEAALAALLDSQDFYAKLMENSMNNRIYVWNSERLARELEKFKDLVQSDFKSKTSLLSEEVVKKHELNLEQYLCRMQKLVNRTYVSKRN